MRPKMRVTDAFVAWILNLGPPVLIAALGITIAATPGGWAFQAIERLAVLVLLLLWVVGVRKVRFEEVRAFLTTSRMSLVIGTAIGLGLFVVEYAAAVAIHFVARIPNIGDGTWNPWVATRSLAEPSLAFLITFAFIGPLVEEVVHRGVALQALRTRLGPVVAAVITALVFTLLHEATIIAFVSSFLFGLVAAWLVERYRSLSPAIAAHVASNFGVAVTGWALYTVFGVPGQVVG